MIVSNAIALLTEVCRKLSGHRYLLFEKMTFPRCPTNFGASLFDITETLSKLTSELRCVQYKRGSSALLQQCLERNSEENAELK